MLNKENTGVSIKSLEGMKRLYIEECSQGAQEHIIENFKQRVNRELTQEELDLIKISLMAGVETFTGFVGILSNHVEADIFTKDNHNIK